MALQPAISHRYAVYVCDKPQDGRAIYAIVRISGIGNNSIPTSLYLNLQGIPASFENATCPDDMVYTGIHSDSFIPGQIQRIRTQDNMEVAILSDVFEARHIIREMLYTSKNNMVHANQLSNPRHAVMRMFHVVPNPENPEEYVLLANQHQEVIQAIFSILPVPYPGANEPLTISNRRQVFFMGIVFPNAPVGGKKSSKTVADLKALCKKRGIRGYSNKNKTELETLLRRGR
jgi:hypothetical protein